VVFRLVNQPPRGWFPAAVAGWAGTSFSRRRFLSISALRENEMGDSRDIQHGVYDPVGGVDMKHRFKETQTPHERAQTAADVRANAVPFADDEFLPEALRRQPAPPLNKRTGRNPTK
jgi:hypothetical protein